MPLATTRPRPTPESDTSTQPERQEVATKGAMDRIEDSLDYVVVKHARALASARDEKSMSWQDFKKKLFR